MSLQLKQSWSLCYEEKVWKIPEDFIKTVDGHHFVKLAGSNATFANFVSPGLAKFQKNLSLSMTKGFKGLQSLRNSAQYGQASCESSLFSSAGPQPKKKARKQTSCKENEVMSFIVPAFDVNPGGNVEFLAVSHPLCDVWVRFDAAIIELCIQYIRFEGLEVEQTRAPRAMEEPLDGQAKVVQMGGGRQAIKAVGADGKASYRYIKKSASGVDEK